MTPAGRVGAERVGAAVAASPLAWTFVWAMATWTIGFLALFRVPWMERGVVQGLVDFQRTLAEWYGATPSPQVLVNSSCSGADQIALCLGVTLAYPVDWTRRIIGALGGLVLVLFLNTVRIGTLLSVATSPDLFETLHLYVWPVVLMAAIGLYVLAWIRWSQGIATSASPALVRFGGLSGLFLLAHGAAAPWMMSSGMVREVGAWTAKAGSMLLGFTGTVSVNANVLITSRGDYRVTEECLLTPLIPLYLAAAVALPRDASRRALALALAVPVFLALGVIRLLIVAVPPSIVSTPLFIVHGFFQLALGVMVVAVAAVYRAEGGRWSASRLAGAAFTAAAVVAAATAPWWNAAVTAAAASLQPLAPHTLATLLPTGDVQGALVLLPVFQIAFLAALWVVATRGRSLRQLGGALGCLALSQVLLLVAIGEIEARMGIDVHPLAIRAWAVAAPVALVLLWTRTGESPIGVSARAAYQAFWYDVGENFPTLTGAASTRYYRANEERLLISQLPNLSTCTLLKTDLWDEVKNTHILQWAAEQGARVYGIDISEAISQQARGAFDGHPVGVAQADVRMVPFTDNSFDAIYSMGTIEHFPESQDAVHELARVLKPGGRLILGVPNLHDPFLRPLLVWLLIRFDLYGYGAERAFSRRQLRSMLETAGLRVEDETGILFIPGWLRMADLWFHTRARSFAWVTSPLVALFEWLDGHFPALRRHGYLIASVGVKPVVVLEGGSGAPSVGGDR